MLGMVLAANLSAELVMRATLVGAAAAVWDARGVAGLPGSPEIADPLFSVVRWLRSVEEGARGAHLAALCAPVQAHGERAAGGSAPGGLFRGPGRL